MTDDSWRTAQNADDWVHEFRGELSERAEGWRMVRLTGLLCLISFTIGVLTTAVSYQFALG